MRKKLLIPLAALLVSLSMTTGIVAVHADPANNIKEAREFFRKKFPEVPFRDYVNGIYALPGFDEYRTQWLAFRDIAPYEIGLENGKQLWEKPFPNGKTFASCFRNGGKNIAQGYPYWDKQTKRVRTAEMDLRECARRNGAELAFLGADLGRDQAARVQLAELSAYFYSLSRGKPIKPDVDFSDPEALKAYEEGKKFWWSRRGQWNFSCSQCHVDLAGRNLGGNQPLSAALGHGASWPAQRLEWARIETLHHRYVTCLSQMRAKPPAYGSPIYDHLELYQKVMSTGLPLNAPAMRN
jgi:sulfur-oxidizing protein SoxA